MAKELNYLKKIRRNKQINFEYVPDQTTILTPQKTARNEKLSYLMQLKTVPGISKSSWPTIALHFFNFQTNKSTSTMPILGQNTPTGTLNSARGSSVYNSRRTSLDNSCGSDMQHVSTNIIEGVEMSYQVPGVGGAGTNSHSTGTSAHTPIDMVFEGNTHKLSKQNSLEKTSATGTAAGNASTTLDASASTTASTTARSSTAGAGAGGGLTQNSIADLEKKLAALRNADSVAEEVSLSSIAQSLLRALVTGSRKSRLFFFEFIHISK